LGIGNWELGIGNWEWRIGNILLVPLVSLVSLVSSSSLSSPDLSGLGNQPVERFVARKF